MYKIERAIILAAGYGNRLLPLTSKIPKPLIIVNNRRMIETTLSGLSANGITEIYIIVGYLKEQFEILKRDYPNITFIENPYYNTCNNISSLFVAREHLHNTMILDADFIIRNPKILQPNFERSCYNAVWNCEPTKEWLLTVENHIVTGCKKGGITGWKLYGISRWNEVDGLRLRHHIEKEFLQRKNTQIYWDDVPLFCYPKEYQLAILEMDANDIVEIDSLEDLQQEDASYLAVATDEE